MSGGPGQADRGPSLDNLVVALSHTTEPGNIGAACRAMKTMGLRRLRLIRPRSPHGPTSRALAHGAEDVLAAAEVVPDLETAAADSVLVAGTTARQRALRKQALLSPRELAERLLPFTATGPVVLLFGTERTGLTNEEANRCRFLSTIGTATPQPSLNLSQAVMLYAWELRKAYLRATGELDPGEQPGTRGRLTGRRAASRADLGRPEMHVSHKHRSTRLPSQFELDAMYAHLAQAMEAVGYSESERRKFLTYLRQLHMRAGIVDWELQIYHLLARRILKCTGKEPFTGGD